MRKSQFLNSHAGPFTALSILRRGCEDFVAKLFFPLSFLIEKMWRKLMTAPLLFCPGCPLFHWNVNSSSMLKRINICCLWTNSVLEKPKPWLNSFFYSKWRWWSVLPKKLILVCLGHTTTSFGAGTPTVNITTTFLPFSRWKLTRTSKELSAQK